MKIYIIKTNQHGALMTNKLIEDLPFIISNEEIKEIKEALKNNEIYLLKIELYNNIIQNYIITN